MFAKIYEIDNKILNKVSASAAVEALQLPDQSSRSHVILVFFAKYGAVFHKLLRSLKITIDFSPSWNSSLVTDRLVADYPSISI